MRSTNLYTVNDLMSHEVLEVDDWDKSMLICQMKMTSTELYKENSPLRIPG